MNGEQLFGVTWRTSEWSAATRSSGGAVAASGLGTARADERWRWAPLGTASVARSGDVSFERSRDVRRTITSPSAVRIPEKVLSMMREAAWRAGRTESEIWAEAAREWLLRRLRDDEPQPPTPAAALPVPRMAQAWRAIDTLLAELRTSTEREPSIAAPAA